MSEIIHQGRATTKMLIVVGALIAWASLQVPPQPITSAQRIVDSVLFSDAWKRTDTDPLAEMPNSLAAPLSQYRHNFANLTFDVSLLHDKRKHLRTMPIGAVLLLGDTHLINTSPLHSSKLSEIFLGPLRAEFGRLESWSKAAGLSPQSTLGDLQDKLAVQIELPIIGQKVSSRTLMTGLLLALIGLQLYQCSLLTTLEQLLPSPNVDALRSWLPFHLSTVGRLLAFAVVVAPALLWIVDQALLASLRTHSPPSVWALLGSALLLTSTAFTLDRQKALRRALDSSAIPTASARPNLAA